VAVSNLSRVFSGKAAAALPVWALPAINAPLAAAGMPAAATASPTLPSAEQLEAIRAQAYADGFASGQRAGVESGRLEVAQRLAELDALLDALARPFADLGVDAERELVSLACDIARQLSHRELSMRPELVVDTVHQALQVLPESARDLVVYLHPDDVALVSALALDERGDRDWRVMADPALGRGDCRIRAGDATVDASLRGRLDNIVATLLSPDALADIGA